MFSVRVTGILNTASVLKPLFSKVTGEIAAFYSSVETSIKNVRELLIFLLLSSASVCFDKQLCYRFREIQACCLHVATLIKNVL